MAAPAFVAVGLNHRSAPIDLLERLTIDETDLDKALTAATGYEHVLEAVIVSTCNRVEVYASVTRFHGGAQDLRNFLAEFCHTAPEDFSSHLYTFHDDAALRHLFRLCAGLDSMVIGETEILGQVRRSWQQASEMGAAKRTLGDIFGAALHAGRKARAASSAPPVSSVSEAAVRHAADLLGGLAGKAATVVGAGTMGTLTARSLLEAGAEQVVVINRTRQRALRAGEMLQVQTRPWEALEETLTTCDLAVFATRAPSVVLGREAGEGVAAERAGRPLLLVDIALPRDVAPDVRSLPGITLLDLDDLKDKLEGGVPQGWEALDSIIDAEVIRWIDRAKAADVGPVVASILERAEAVRAAETASVTGPLSTLSDDQRAAVDRLTRRIVAKVLHPPISRARELAAGKDGPAHIQTLRELFDPPPEATDED